MNKHKESLIKGMLLLVHAGDALLDQLKRWESTYISWLKDADEMSYSKSESLKKRAAKMSPYPEAMLAIFRDLERDVQSETFV